MNKSLNFVKQRISSGLCNNMDIKDFEKIYVCSFKEALKVGSKEIQDAFKDNETIITIENGANKKQVSINYSPESEFEYFTMESCVCDGTLMFIDELILKILYKLIRSETYNKETAPVDYLEDIWRYDIQYTIGDYVINNEYGDFGTKEKPWMHSRFTAMLPIKCKIMERL